MTERGGGMPEMADVRSLLFVCTGNTCRSPMAEALAREALAERLPGVSVGSAGTFASEGVPAAPEARDVAAEHGLDLGGHRSRPLSEAMATGTDLVLCMADSHRRSAMELGAGARAVLLTRFLPEDDPHHDRSVVDPIGGGRQAYEESFAILERAVSGLVESLAAARNGPASGGGRASPAGDGA